MHAPPSETAAFPGFIDLASSRLGGRAIVANDEFFAGKDNLLKPERATFDPIRFTDHGKWMDGWETRRRRTPGHDWCVVRLGLAGSLRGFDIDTSHFLGNHPAYASIDAIAVDADVSPEALAGSDGWREILPRSPLRPGSQNVFAALDHAHVTHLRLNIFPDGGVARLRAYGRVRPSLTRRAGPVDLAAVENGGLVVAASDMFFGSKENLIMPGDATHMGDGWETRRRRGPGNDWAVVALGTAAPIQKVVVDTSHFKGNYPDSCQLEACLVTDMEVDALNAGALPWRELLRMIKLRPDTKHVFERELVDLGPVSHVRLSIYPDGGVARLRVWGELRA